MSRPEQGIEHDDELARRARKRDAGAVALLYRRHAPALLEYLHRVSGDRAEAEDVMHDSFLRIFEGRGTYEGRDRFRAWLYTIGTRILRDRGRLKRRHAELLLDAGADLLPSSLSGPADDLQRDQLLQRVESALSDLPEAYSAAFHLRVRESLSYKEIAAIRSEPEGTIRSRVHHTLRRIRTALLSEERPEQNNLKNGENR